MDEVQLIELPSFMRRAEELLSDLELWELEDFLAANPEAGDRIPKGHGLRKLRWGLKRQNRGTRGGVRVVYYYRIAPRTLFMVALFAKSQQADLTPAQLKDLATLCRENLR